MKVRSIRAKNWRNIQQLDFQVEPTANLVCLVGPNGSGKSNVFELISAAAAHTGLTPGIGSTRGDPFADGHDELNVRIELTESVARTALGSLGVSDLGEWDRTLTVRSSGPGKMEIVGEHLPVRGTDPVPPNNLRDSIQQLPNLNFLALDADRAYPKIEISPHEIGSIIEREWSSPANLKAGSFFAARQLYDEWTRYMLGVEQSASSRLTRDIRRAREAGTADPVFVDPFEGYKTSLTKVLPHLSFMGVDAQRKAMLFDTVGQELRFDQLSGGEREIAFLIGQIERFALKRGLFLVDEPELHLNPDLIREWVQFLKASIEEGQVWLATHSLEAVEVAGASATFVLEKNAERRKVTGARSLAEQPLRIALSRSLGTPAFAVDRLRYVFVEGEVSLGERERFRSLCPDQKDVRFIEAGACVEVARRVDAVQQLAREGAEPIRVGGVIDKDWRDEGAPNAIASTPSILILPVHEVENLFIEPNTVAAMLEQNGRTGAAHDLIRDEADRRAGSWIHHKVAMNVRRERIFVKIRTAKQVAMSQTWGQISRDPRANMQAVLGALQGESAHMRQIEEFWMGAYRAYEAARLLDGLWTECEGKQVFSGLAGGMGFVDSKAAEAAILALWKRRPDLLPSAVSELRRFVGAL